ncbi:MAG: hypothetical protein ABIW34_05425 [Ginsengibacter sp.]
MWQYIQVKYADSIQILKNAIAKISESIYGAKIAYMQFKLIYVKELCLMLYEYMEQKT